MSEPKQEQFLAIMTWRGYGDDNDTLTARIVTGVFGDIEPLAQALAKEYGLERESNGDNDQPGHLMVIEEDCYRAGDTIEGLDGKEYRITWKVEP